MEKLSAQNRQELYKMAFNEVQYLHIKDISTVRCALSFLERQTTHLDFVMGGPLGLAFFDMEFIYYLAILSSLYLAVWSIYGEKLRSRKKGAPLAWVLSLFSSAVCSLLSLPLCYKWLTMGWSATADYMILSDHVSARFVGKFFGAFMLCDTVFGNCPVVTTTLLNIGTHHCSPLLPLITASPL